MILRRAAVVLVAALAATAALTGCASGPGTTPAGSSTAPGDKDERAGRPTAAGAPSPTWDPLDPDGPTPSDRVEPETDLSPQDVPVTVPGPRSPGEASVSVYAGVDRGGRVHVGGQVATRAQRAALVRAAAASGRQVDDSLPRVVGRPTTRTLDRAVAAVGRYLAGADDADGSLKLWLLDATVLAQARDEQGIWRPVADGPTAAVLRDGGVEIGPRPSMAYYGSELGTAIGDAMDGTAWLFPRGSARVDADLGGRLKLLPGWITGLVDQPGIRVLVTTHATRSEAAGRADALTLERAKAVKAFLVAHGVAPERVGVLAYGDRQPADGLTYLPGERWAGRVEVYAVG